MDHIKVLDNETIDKIAAGEVVERPASVVKELVENAIDAGATAIVVEIKEGGISFIRVTDNGKGIESDQVRNAFLRHATSKITTLEDLSIIESLGFRGEALSSIAAVAQVEMMTKRKDRMLGTHYCIEGGREVSFEEVGLPDGTTILVKNLFYHIPARRKFLKTATTEGGYIADLLEHLAMSKPEISFRFISNGQVRFHTSGNGDVKEIVYRIFGREFLKDLLPFEACGEGISIHGYLGKPELNRSNRNFENCFLNGRYIKSSFFMKAIEEGYRPYLMQHKFPFVILYFKIDTHKVDINVHPTKMDIRITDGKIFFDFISTSIRNCLLQQELIPSMEQTPAKENRKQAAASSEKLPEPFEKNRMEAFNQNTLKKEAFQRQGFTPVNSSEKLSFLKEAVFSYETKPIKPPSSSEPPEKPLPQEVSAGSASTPFAEKEKPAVLEKNEAALVQLNLFEEKIITEENEKKFQVLGQVFDTYWLITYEDKLLFVDQHSAHEKVKFEKLMKEISSGQVYSQTLQPPRILHLTQKEEALLTEYDLYFRELGFSWEEFGEHSIALREIPMDLYGKKEQELFLEILDELSLGNLSKTPEVIREKIISMSCKAAVKGNQAMSSREMEALLKELFHLENPYHCPHGRPTIISMTKTEMEKKFKRIV